MKRNWDLIRKILLELEKKADNSSWLESTSIKGYDAHTVSYHYKLLNEAGLIEITDLSSIEEIDFAATALTWQGHEFLDKIRNDTVWNKVKSVVQSKSLNLSFEVIKTVAASVITAMLQ